MVTFWENDVSSFGFLEPFCFESSKREILKQHVKKVYFSQKNLEGFSPIFVMTHRYCD